MPPRATTLLAHAYRGGEPRPETVTIPTTLIPTGVFPCLDGHVALMSTPQQLNEMLDVLDDDNLRAAFARPDPYERTDTKEFVDAALYPWLFSHTRAEATALAQAAGWPFAGVNTMPEVLDADHLHQRGFWVHTDDLRAGSIDLVGPWCRFAEGGWALRRLAPELGDHNAEADAPTAPVATRATAVRDRPPEPPLRGHPRRRPDDGVGRAVRHHAARRPRRRGDPGREPVRAAADHEGVSPPAGHLEPRVPQLGLRAFRPGPSRSALQPALAEQQHLPEQAVLHDRHPGGRRP